MTAEQFTEFCYNIGTRFGWPLAYWLAFATEWATWEGTNAQYNPLATTQTMAGSTPFNSAGVQNYPDPPTGELATIYSLDPTQYNGIDYYPAIRAAIVSQSIDASGRDTVAAEVRTWGTTGFANLIEQGWNPMSEQDANPPATKKELDALNSAALARFAAIANSADLMVAEYERTGDLHRALSEWVTSLHRASNPEQIPA